MAASSRSRPTSGVSVTGKPLGRAGACAVGEDTHCASTARADCLKEERPIIVAEA